MEKTKLGLSVPVASALVYLLMLFGGYTAGLLAIGYILLREENEGLKKHALTTLLVAICISVVNLLIGVLPEVVDLFRTFAAIFDEYVESGAVSSLSGFLYAALSLAKTVVFLVLAWKAYKGRYVKLGFIEKFLN